MQEKEKIIETAVNYKRSGRYNCAQAVLIALKDDAGLSSEELLSIGSGFCAGMGNKEATCGALIGVGIVAGLYTKGKGTLMLNRQMVELFKEKSKATICKDLKEIINGRPLCPCDDCVRHAMEVYFEVVRKE